MENLNPKISYDKTTPVECEECKGQIFVPAFLLRKVSKLLIGAPEDAIIPIDVFACAKCGHINKEFLPKEENDRTIL